VSLQRIIASCIAVAALGVICGCGSKPVIGVLLPMSGDAATYGASMKNAIEMGVEGLSDGQGGASQTTVVWADSGSAPSTAADGLRSLATEQGAKIVVSGTTSPEVEAMLEVFDHTDSVGLSPSATGVGLTKASKRFFRVLPSDDLEGRRAGRFLAEERDCSTVAVITGLPDGDGIEKPFREMFEQSLSGTVTERVAIDGDGWRQELETLVTTEPPDGVYVIGFAGQIAEVVGQLRAADYGGIICTTSALNSSAVIAEHAAILENVYFPQPNFDLEDPRPLVQEFVTAYRSRYGHDPDIYAAHAYDAIRLAAQAVETASVYDTEVLRQTLQFGITEFPGVTGVIRFNDYGDIHRNPIMFIVRDGRVRNFERFLKEEKKRIRDKLRELLTSG
jgi:branched-chain amino acid transport system substrate-binding protein